MFNDDCRAAIVIGVAKQILFEFRGQKDIDEAIKNLNVVLEKIEDQKEVDKKVRKSSHKLLT